MALTDENTQLLRIRQVQFRARPELDHTEPLAGPQDVAFPRVADDATGYLAGDLTNDHGARHRRVRLKDERVRLVLGAGRRIPGVEEASLLVPDRADPP